MMVPSRSRSIPSLGKLTGTVLCISDKGHQSFQLREPQRWCLRVSNFLQAEKWILTHSSAATLTRSSMTEKSACGRKMISWLPVLASKIKRGLKLKTKLVRVISPTLPTTKWTCNEVDSCQPIHRRSPLVESPKSKLKNPYQWAVAA